MPTMNTIKLSIIIVTYNAALTIERVLENIIHNKTEPVTAQEGVHVMQIIEAALQSSEQKTVINL